MIRFFIAALILFSTQANADSLVCEYNGQTLIYTEVNRSENTKSIDVEYVSMNTVTSVIRYHNGKEYRFGNIIPCVMIKEKVNETKNLNDFLNQFK